MKYVIYNCICINWKIEMYEMLTDYNMVYYTKKGLV